MRLAPIVGLFVLGVAVVTLTAGPGPAQGPRVKPARKGQKKAAAPRNHQGPGSRGAFPASRQKKAAAAARKQPDQALAHQLQQTAQLLTRADRDYQGHRAAAVRHIRHAIGHLKKEAHLRGFKVMNDFKGPEPQPVSDAQLRQAASNLGAILKQLNSLQRTAHRGKAAEQIGKAIAELGTALKIA